MDEFINRHLPNAYYCYNLQAYMVLFIDIETLYFRRHFFVVSTIWNSAQHAVQHTGTDVDLAHIFRQILNSVIGSRVNVSTYRCTHEAK